MSEEENVSSGTGQRFLRNFIKMAVSHRDLRELREKKL
jgi:hypothetical protein